MEKQENKKRGSLLRIQLAAVGVLLALIVAAKFLFPSVYEAGTEIYRSAVEQPPLYNPAEVSQALSQAVQWISEPRWHND